MASEVEDFLQNSGSVEERPEQEASDVNRWMANTDKADKLKLSLDQGAAVDPDMATRTIALQGKTGLPGELIERNLDEMERRATFQDLNAREYRKSAPKVSDWLGEHPNNVAAAKEDLVPMGYVERQFRHIGQQFRLGRRTVELSRIGESAMWKKRTPVQSNRQKAIESELEDAQDFGITGFFEGIPGAVSNQLPIFANTLKGKVKGAAVAGVAGAAKGAAVAAVAGQLGPQAATPEEVVTVPAAAMIGGKGGAFLGWRYGAGVEAGRLEAGLAFLEYEKEKDDAGNLLTYETAVGASLITGTLNGALEMVGFEAITKAFPGASAFKRGAVRALLRNPTTRQAFMSAAKNIGGAVGQEGATEFMQEMVKTASGEIGKMIQDGTISKTSMPDIFARIFSEQNVQEALQAGRAGAQAGGGISTAGAGVSVALDVRRAREAKSTSNALKEIGKTTADTKLFEKLPAKTQELVSRITRDGPVETLYAPLDTWKTYWQGQGLDPREVAREVIGSDEAFDEAEAMKSDIAIPTDRYATTIGPSPHGEFFAAELRKDPLDMNARESDEFFKRMDEMDDQAQDPEIMAAEEIGADIESKLVAAGVKADTATQYAKIYSRMFRTLGKRFGMDPAALFSRFGLSITRQFPRVAKEKGIDALDPTLDRLRAGEIPTEVEARGENIIDFLTRIGGLDPEGAADVAAREPDLQRRPFQKKLLREGGRSLDDAAEQAVESGFIQERDVNALVGAIDQTLRGSPVFSIAEEAGAAIAERESFLEFEDYLDRIGLDVQTMDNEQIKTALRMAEEAERATRPAEAAELRPTERPSVRELSQESPEGLSEPDPQRLGFEPLDNSVTENPVFVKAMEDARPFLDVAAKKLGGDPDNPAFIVRVYREGHGRIHDLVSQVRVAGKTMSAQDRQRISDEMDSLGLQEAALIRISNLVAAPKVWLRIYEAKDAGKKPTDKIPEDVMYSKKFLSAPDVKVKQVPKGPRLSVLHNLSEENLAAARDLGGIAVPSLAVVPEGKSIHGFGEITMIGTEDLADPTKEPVFDSDAYSPRFPSPIYKKISVKVADPIVNEFREFARIFEEMFTLDHIWDKMVNYPDPAEIVTEALRSNAVAAWFLSDTQDIKVAPVKKEVLPKDLETPWIATPSFQKYLDSTDDPIPSPPLEGYDQGPYKRFSDAVEKAIDEYILSKDFADTVSKRPEDRSESRDLYRKLLIDEDDGLVNFGNTHGIERSIKRLGTQEIQKEETDLRVSRRIRGQEEQLRNWLEQKIISVFAAPRIKLRGRLVDYNLQNIVSAMTGRVRNKEQGLTFSEGATRASVSKRFKSLEQMRRAAARSIVPQQEVNAARKKAADMLSEFRLAVVDFYSFTTHNLRTGKDDVDTWGGFDAAMRAISRWVKSGRNAENLRRVLGVEGYKVEEIPEEAIALGMEAGELFLRAPVVYFEAKPQRAVTLPEFKGAVIPADATEKTKETLRANRIEFMEYKRHSETDRQKAVNTLRERLAKQQEKVLFQDPSEKGRESEARGRIRFDKEAANPNFNIEFLKNADLSTFLHESGHYFLEVIGSLAEEKGAPQEALDDWAQILAYLGVKSKAEIGDEQHELWARSFEAYLFEGKAPTTELAKAFAKFRAWLIAVYHQLKGINVELTDEIRGVMDRMLATREEIQNAQAETSFSPLFPDPRVVGMTEKQARKYRGAVEDAKRSAEETLSVRVFDEMQREQKAEWKARRAEVLAEVEDEVDQRPVYIALSVLQTGKLPDGSDLPAQIKAVKLSKKTLIELYGKDFLKRLPKPFVYAQEGGVDPSTAADLFGFRSGDELVFALANAQKKNQLVEALTDDQMRERFGDLMTDGTLQEKAIEAVHTDKRAELLRRELQLLASGQLSALKGIIRRIARRAPTIQEIKVEAERVIAAKRVREIVPTLYQRGEIKSAKQAVEAMLRGDFEGAFDAKARELLNHELFRAAVRARDESDSIVRFMSKFNKRSIREKIAKGGGGHLEQIDAILERFDFRRSVTLKAIEKRKSLARWIQEQQEEGLTIDLPEKVLNEANRKSFKDTPMEELRGIRDSVKNIEHLARLKGKLLANARTRNIEQARDEIIASIQANHDITPEPPDFAPSLGKRIIRGARGVFAAHTKLEFMFKFLDGKVAKGPVWEHLFAPMARAEAEEQRLTKGVIAKLREIFGVYGRFERANWFLNPVDIPEIGSSMSKANMLAVALNMGNEYNRDALKRGYGWSDGQIEAILKHLEKKDWDTVQKIWNYIDSFWPLIKIMEEELNGIAPKKVEAQSFPTKFGLMKGGYYPITFDSKMSWRQAKVEDAESVREMFGGQWARAQTRSGHTKERTSTGGKPILLELTAFTGHITNVVHDLAFRRAVIDVNRLVEIKEIREAIEGAAGREMYRQLRPWLQGIASDRRGEYSHPIEGLLGRARMGATVVNMGLKMTTAAVQILGYSVSAKELGPKYSAIGLDKAFRKPHKLAKTWQFITDRSQFMRNRMNNFDRDVRDALSKLTVAGVRPGVLGLVDSYTGPLQDSWFSFIGIMDLAVSVPTWLGAYQKAMDGDAEGIEAGDEMSAAEFGDQAVRITQGSGSAKDLALVQRGAQAWRLFTMFFSFFSVLGNQFGRTWTEFKADRNFPKLVASTAMLWFIPAVLEDLGLSRGPGEDADEEEWVKWFAETQLAYPFQTVVLLRDIINGMDRFGYEPSAAFDAFEYIARTGKLTGKQLIGAATGDRPEIERKDIKTLVMTAGYLAALPSRQVWLTSEYIYDWMTGKVDPESPVEGFWRALVIGKKRKRR